MNEPAGGPPVALTFAGSGDAFGSGGRYQACIHRVIAYTGDTAWTDDLLAAAAGADLLIAEAYYARKAVPYHLRYADLAAHGHELASRRIVLTHLSADMLARSGADDDERRDGPGFETAHDGLVIRL